MAGGLPAPESFPVDRLRAAADAVLSGAGRYGPEAIQYGPTEGVLRCGTGSPPSTRPAVGRAHPLRCSSPRAHSKASIC